MSFKMIKKEELSKRDKHLFDLTIELSVHLENERINFMNKHKLNISEAASVLSTAYTNMIASNLANFHIQGVPMEELQLFADTIGTESIVRLKDIIEDLKNKMN